MLLISIIIFKYTDGFFFSNFRLITIQKDVLYYSFCIILLYYSFQTITFTKISNFFYALLFVILYLTFNSFLYYFLH